MTNTVVPASISRSQATITREQLKVIVASSLGTVFEWYDFFLYGALAPIIATQFFAGVNPTAGFIFALLAFAAGFVVRPFGALVFGRLGDLIGRKYSFLITIVIMGLSTFAVGLLPVYTQVGLLAPTLLIALRLLQGLAIGGEYGGAAVYLAEHSPNDRRGYFTGWLQTTGTVGLFLSLVVILGTRTHFGEAEFQSWGWRIPFLISIVLLAISVWVRTRLNESPLFRQMKAEGRLSKSPLRESFCDWSNLKIVLVATFGLTAGQAVVWYVGHFYSMYFLTQILKVQSTTAILMFAIALPIVTPFFVLWGAVSDRIGRRTVVMAGLMLALISFFPAFKGLTLAANPELAAAQANAPVSVRADPATCSFQFNPVGTSAFTTSCDIAKAALTQSAVNYENLTAPAGTIASVHVGDIVIESFDGTVLSTDERKAQMAKFAAAVTKAIRAAGYPTSADPARINYAAVIALLVLLTLPATMVYGPIAAYLVELFPTRIRYTSVSLPYHVGNGWFGGFLPASSFAIVAATGNIYSGLWYPVIVSAMSLAVGMIFLKDTRGATIHDAV